ncbi:Regulatory protein wetA [Cytospora mali]|uniref:Regulatory protein wetA n=1 Tax=Cytospora mali TaxID=578113 RepID=A0A194WCH6_CYTMA|nr:Regulatory protein wetA [Valsa mali]
MAFARAMDYTIDKDEFWHLSCSTGQAGAGASSTAEEQQRFPSDFFDQFVVMEEGSGADFTRKPSSDSFFVPLQDGQQGPGGDGMSPLTSSVSEDITNTLSNTDSAALSYTTSNLSSVDGRPAQLASLAAETHKKQQQPQPAPQGQAAGRDGNSDTSHHVVLGQLNPETLEQRRRLLTGRRGQNPQPASGGSISDSELLQLEGLSVNSPRKMATHHGPASSTPPTMQSFGPSTTTTTTTTGNISGLTDDIDLSSIAKNQQIHKSGSRRFETIYSTIRRAVGGHSRGRVQQQHPNTAPIPQTVIPSHMESAKKATRRLASESQAMPTSWNGLPISPALTEMANVRPNDASAFVNGYLDDPFFDPSLSFHNTGGLAPAAQINGGKKLIYHGAIPHTPSRTPIIKAETTNGDDISQFFPTTSESWGLDATFATTPDLSNNNNNNNNNNILSFDGTGMDTWGFDPPSDGGNHGMAHLGTSLPETSSRNHHNLTIQVPPTYARDHRHSAPGADDLATNGLMIHMPQPQTPSTAPLLSSQVMPGMHDGSAYPFPDEHPQPMHTFRSGGGGGGGPYTGDHGRRHKPPAPSSGARYMGAATISPRKTRPPSSLSSSSPSPTPAGGGGGGGGRGGGQRRSRSATRRAPSLHRVSTSDMGGIAAPTTDTQSHAIRKRRSASSWLGGRRTTSNAASVRVGDVMMASSSAGSGEGGGQIGFVNYTPNDHNVLMTGVAPSGSSKTKARREKEAMERQRKLSEAVRKAVTAAGVDVGRLKEEGIVI